jgi:hypothetical protein
MAITLKRVLLVAGAPVAVAAALGGSAVFANQFGGGPGNESFEFRSHQSSQEDGGHDKDGCPFDRGGSDGDDEAAAEQT